MYEWITRLFKRVEKIKQDDTTKDVKTILNKLKNIEGLQNILMKYSYEVNDEYDALMFFKFKDNCGKSKSEMIHLMQIEPYSTSSYSDFYTISVKPKEYAEAYYTKELSSYFDKLNHLEVIFNNMTKDEQNEFTSLFIITLSKLYEYLKNVTIPLFEDEQYLLSMEVLNHIIAHCENQNKQITHKLRDDVLMEIKYLKCINEGEPSNFEKLVTAYDGKIN